MLNIHRCSARSCFGFLLATTVSSLTHAAPPDADLTTQYQFEADFSAVLFVVCGNLQLTSGCYASGFLGPFGHVGAILEGVPSTAGDTLQRGIYIIDVAGGTGRNEVTLYRYLQTNTISASYDTVTTKLTNKLSLPLVGGATARCSVAANADFLFIGTNQSTQAVRLTKGSFAIQTIPGFSDGSTVTSITSDASGYVNVLFGEGTGYVLFGPSGNAESEGGGQSFLASTTTGLSSQDVPLSGGLSTASKFEARPVTFRPSPVVSP